jgi:hypothetical protein
MIISNKIIQAVYFFRKSCIQVEKGMEVLSCFASIKTIDLDLDIDIFQQGFKIVFWEIANKHNFGFCAIENITHNNVILENILLKTKSMIKSPTAYFFYNFACRTFPAEKCFILH